MSNGHARPKSETQERHVRKTRTTAYDVAEHLRTPDEMAAYLEACAEESGGDAAFIAKARGDVARGMGMARTACDSKPALSHDQRGEGHGQREAQTAPFQCRGALPITRSGGSRGRSA